MNYRSLIMALAFAFASLPAIASQPHPVTIDDYDGVKFIGPPAISADGKYVAYVYDERIYAVAPTGGEARPVTSALSSASAPRWSGDGSVLYFLSDRSGLSQLWKLPVDSFGEALQVTDLERGVDTLNFSYDQSRLLLRFDDKPDSRHNKWTGKERQDPWVITRLQFKHDAADGFLTERPSDHLYAYDIAAKTLTPLTSGPYTESDGAWSPDGRKIVFVSNREKEPDASYKTDLWITDAAAPDDDAEGRTAAVRLTTSDDVKSEPAWSPNGKSIAYLTAEDGVYGINRLAIIPAAGGAPDILTKALDRWVRSFRFSDDGKWIYFVFDEHGGQYFARVRVSDGTVERLLEGEHNVTAFDFDDSGDVILRLNNMNDAPNLYRLRRGKLSRLTGINEAYLATLKRGSKEKISFKSADGTVVEAFVTKPPGYDAGRRYPAILKIHGGPVGQYTYGYSFDTQFLAANGYVVVEPNPRGSTGRGQAFVRGIYRTWGITDYADDMAAIETIVEKGIADPARLAVTGYSYGGYMTNVVITRTNRFKAAATGAGHSLIAANYGHDIYQRWYNWELGVPWEHRDRYDVLSPLLRAGKVETPTIFLGGRIDWNVPILNAELFYQRLRERGIDTELVVYPRTHHSGWTPRFDKDYLKRVVAWFDRHVKGE